MEFRKLGDGLGMEVSRVDLSRPIPANEFKELWNAFFENQVLVIRSQKLKAGGFLAFANCFGKPEPHVIDQFHHPEHADILILSNVEKDGRPTGLADAGTYFHTDHSYLEVPARATMLYSIQVPRRGGDTPFANQYAAYDDLSPELKNRIENLVALHHYGNRDDLDKSSRTVASVLTEEQEKMVTRVRHRVARPHPVTGRTALYAVNGSSFGIEGMPEQAALALLRELARHATQEKYQLRLKYGVGDVAIWDNASLLHSATLTDPQYPRTLWRTTVKEEGRPS
ncbi:MAG: TauD/TfdA family dioxygenase [Burkholderiales bacterium]